MKTRGIAVGFVLLLITAALLACFGKRTPDPVYQGRPLSDWIDMLNDISLTASREEHAQAAEAIREIGANALPMLISRLQETPARWLWIRRFVPSFFWTAADLRSEEVKTMRPGQAVAILALLGTNAFPAIPQLAVIAQDSPHRAVATRAAIALAQMGPPGWCAVLPALRDPHARNHDVIAKTISDVLAGLGEGEATRPLALKNALNDSDPRVREIATNLLKAISRDHGGYTSLR